MQRPRAILLLLGGVWLTTGACSVHTGARPPTAPSPTATFHPVTTPTGSAAAPATSGTAPTTPVPTPVATTMAGTAPGNTPVQPGYWPTQGWTAAQPEDQGMDPQLPAQVDDYVR